MPAPAPFTPAVVPGTDSQPTAVPPKSTLQKKEIPSTDNKVIGAKIIIQFLGADKKVYEAETVISQDEFKVQEHLLHVKEVHEKKRDPETKDLIGFEDTGERILTFKLRYHVR